MNNLLRTAITSALVTMSFFGPLLAQNVPIDFEPSGNGALWNWNVFENDANPPLEIVDNPDMSGINQSCMVAKFTALTAGQPFAGCESMHGGGIGQFIMDSTNSIINIMVWKPIISDVGIKLVRSDNWSLGEIKIPNTKINEWELLTFDFSAHIGNDYDQIVIFPDFDLSGRTQDNVIYFDNVYGVDSVTTLCGNNALSETQDENFRVFPNPANQSFTVQSESTMENISVYDLMGSEVYSERTTGLSVNIDISGLTDGIYIIEVTSNGTRQRETIVKEH